MLQNEIWPAFPGNVAKSCSPTKIWPAFLGNVAKSCSPTATNAYAAQLREKIMLFEQHTKTRKRVLLTTRVLRSGALLLCGWSMGCQPEQNREVPIVDCTLGVIRTERVLSLFEFINSDRSTACRDDTPRGHADVWRLISFTGGPTPTQEPIGTFPLILDPEPRFPNSLWIFPRTAIQERFGTGQRPISRPNLEQLTVVSTSELPCTCSCGSSTSTIVVMKPGSNCPLPGSPPEIVLPESSPGRQQADCSIRLAFSGDCGM